MATLNAHVVADKEAMARVQGVAVECTGLEEKSHLKLKQARLSRNPLALMMLHSAPEKQPSPQALGVGSAPSWSGAMGDDPPSTG